MGLVVDPVVDHVVLIGSQGASKIIPFTSHAVYFLDYTTSRLKIRHHIAAFVNESTLEQKLLADFSSICIISLSKRI